MVRFVEIAQGDVRESLGFWSDESNGRIQSIAQAMITAVDILHPRLVPREDDADIVELRIGHVLNDLVENLDALIAVISKAIDLINEQNAFG